MISPCVMGVGGKGLDLYNLSPDTQRFTLPKKGQTGLRSIPSIDHATDVENYRRTNFASQNIVTALAEMNDGDLKKVMLDNQKGIAILFREDFTPPRMKTDVIIASFEYATPQEKEGAYTRMQEVLNDLRQGVTFQKIFRRSNEISPDGKFHLQTTEYHENLDVNSRFASFIRRLKPGEFSDIIEYDASFVIYQREEEEEIPAFASYTQLTITGPNANERADEYLNILLNGGVEFTIPALHAHYLFFPFPD